MPWARYSHPRLARARLSQRDPHHHRSSRRYRRGAGGVARDPGPDALGLLAVAEGVAEALEDIGAASRRCVARRILLRAAGVEDFDRGVEVRIVDQRDPVTLAPGTVDDAVLGRREEIVGPARQQVADIDDEGSRNRRRVDPPAI